MDGFSALDEPGMVMKRLDLGADALGLWHVGLIEEGVEGDLEEKCINKRCWKVAVSGVDVIVYGR